MIGRILVIDGDPSMHQAVRDVLAPRPVRSAGRGVPGSVVLAVPARAVLPAFEVDSAFEGKEGLALLCGALEAGQPYTVAFVGARMSSGWDGVETTARLWKHDPELQVVLSAATSDKPVDDLVRRLGGADRWVIVKKPLPALDILQFANALTAKRRFFLQNCTRLPDGEAMGRERTVALREINQRLAAELKRATESAAAAAASSRAKGEFLAHMSHEVRTPINGVLGLTNLLLATPLTVQQRDLVESIRCSAGVLLRIVNDILDLSRIEAGKVGFEDVAFDLREAVEGALDAVGEKAARKGLELAGAVQAGMARVLRGDPVRLQQVLTNLLDNAVKFTEQGEVILRATPVEETRDRVRIRFEIADSGMGIAPEMIPQLFQPFCQAGEASGRRFGGTGLGLAISKQLVEMMRGEIGLESRLGKGTTSWFTVELDKAESAPALVDAGVWSLAGERVLVVDDHTSTRRILVDLLNTHGLVGAGARTGAEALHRLREAAVAGRPYHVVLLDERLPDRSVWELAQAIEADSLGLATKRVLLCSLTRQVDEAVWRHAGFDGCLVKPLREARLWRCLAGLRGVDLPLEPTVGGKQIEAVVQEPRTLRILLAEDDRINQQVALGLLRQLGCSADVVTTGLAALDALRRAPYDLVLMDCQMPELDGVETARRIREEERKAPTPRSGDPIRIVGLAARAMPGDREQCLAAGMDDYLSKPVRLEDLARVVACCRRANPMPGCAAPEGRESRSEATALAGLGAAVHGPVDLARLLEAVNGHPREARELADLFLEQTSEGLRLLEPAIEDGSTAHVEQLAHQLGGASASCGATALVGPLKELEDWAREGGRDPGRARALHQQLRRQYEEVEEYLAASLPAEKRESAVK